MDLKFQVEKYTSIRKKKIIIYVEQNVWASKNVLYTVI